jgi:thiamine-phosphate pyrophosphorylase
MKKSVRGIHILLGANSVNGRTSIELVEIAVAGGASVVQLREKEMPMDELLPIAKKIRVICRDITFIVNDRADLAKIIDADGVHLGQDDLPIDYAREILGKSSIIGISCGSVEEAMAAEEAGADYIGFGHMYPTSSKLKMTPQRSLEELQLVWASVKIPVIAIGGISVGNVTPIIKCNVGGVAILSAFSGAEDPNLIMQSFQKVLMRDD